MAEIGIAPQWLLAPIIPKVQYTNPEHMHVDQFLKPHFVSKPKKGAVGTESDWLQFCNLQVEGTSIWVGDANFVPNKDDGFTIDVDAGRYSVTVKAMDFGGDKRVSRLRIVLQDSIPEVQGKIGETWTDTAITGVCDHQRFAEVWGEASDAIIRPTLDNYTENYGIAVLEEARCIIMPFVDSGFGDGTFPVFELKQAGRRVGIEVEFISKDEPYPF